MIGMQPAESQFADFIGWGIVVEVQKAKRKDE